MRIVSDLLQKEFKTVDECLKAEADYTAKLEAEKLAKEKAKEEEETSLKEVEVKYREFEKAAAEHCKKYGKVKLKMKNNDFFPNQLYHYLLGNEEELFKNFF